LDDAAPLGVAALVRGIVSQAGKKAITRRCRGGADPVGRWASKRLWKGLLRRRQSLSGWSRDRGVALAARL